MDNRISTIFIGNLKLGDNICFNVESTQSLYKNLNVNQPINIKPIVIINASITEALMIDFVRRVKIHTKEFTYLDEKIRSQVRNLKSDKEKFDFKTSINKFRHYNLLGAPNNFYECLQFLREIRNKVHIQSTFYRTNENEAWTKDVLTISELCVEYTLRYLSLNYPRPLKEDFVGGLSIAWNPHFSENSNIVWKNVKIPS